LVAREGEKRRKNGSRRYKSLKELGVPKKGWSQKEEGQRLEPGGKGSGWNRENRLKARGKKSDPSKTRGKEIERKSERWGGERANK